MKNVYIDGGARIGETIECFLDKRSDMLGSEVYFFECNPSHYETLKKLKETNTNYKIEVYTEALWNEVGEHDFFISIDKWGDLGCTLDNSKQELLDKNNPLKVKTIKLSDFLDNFDKNDYIIVKLDIEGAEYEVVKDLIDSGKIDMINEIYIEWHEGFYPKRRNDFIALKNKLREYKNLYIGQWY